jgi:hypothetical protein
MVAQERRPSLCRLRISRHFSHPPQHASEQFVSESKSRPAVASVRKLRRVAELRSIYPWDLPTALSNYASAWITVSVIL